MILNLINRVFFFVLIFADIGLLLSAENNLSNLNIIEKELQNALDSTLQAVIQGGEELELVFNDISDEKKAFLKTFFIDYLTKKEVTVRIDSAALNLEIEQFDVKIVYNETSAKVWGISDVFDREIVIILKGVIEDQKNNKLHSLSVDKISADKISSKNIKNIENSPYSFTRGRLLKKSSWTNFVEPVVVSISAATIILLFFILRT